MQLQVITPAMPLWSDILQHFQYDFYHLPGYVSIEAKRIQAIPEAIAIEDEGALFFVPYLLRQCSQELIHQLQAPDVFDVVSPAGYPGILLNPAAIDRPGFLVAAMTQLIQQFRAKQVCSAFLRLHPILNHNFAQLYAADACTAALQTVSIDLTCSEAELWQQTRSIYRNLIRKGERLGFVARMVPFVAYLDEFMEIYQETMQRVEAASDFYFDRAYFQEFAAVLGERLQLCLVELQQQIVCAGLFTECGGIVQYHLSGSRAEFLKQSPTVFMLHYARSWAKARGQQILHLGGGVGGSQDSLYHFKSGFSPQRCSFPILRLITNEAVYQRLVELQATVLNTSTEQLLQHPFFPAYRCQTSPLKEALSR